MKNIISKQVHCFVFYSVFTSVSQIFLGNQICRGQVLEGNEHLPLNIIVAVWCCILTSTVSVCVIYFNFHSCYVLYKTV